MCKNLSRVFDDCKFIDRLLRLIISKRKLLTELKCLDLWCSVNIIAGLNCKNTIDRRVNNLARSLQLQLCAFVQNMNGTRFFTLKILNDSKMVFMGIENVYHWICTDFTFCRITLVATLNAVSLNCWYTLLNFLCFDQNVITWRLFTRCYKFCSKHTFAHTVLVFLAAQFVIVTPCVSVYSYISGCLCVCVCVCVLNTAVCSFLSHV